MRGNGVSRAVGIAALLVTLLSAWSISERAGAQSADKYDRKAATKLEHSWHKARDEWFGAMKTARELADQLERTTCITPEGYKSLAANASSVISRLKKTAEGDTAAWLADMRYSNPDFQPSENAEHILTKDTDAVIERIIDQLARLKANPCPPDQVFHTVAPRPLPLDSVVPVVGDLAGTPGQTTTVCSPCQWYADQINRVNKEIDKWTRIREAGERRGEKNTPHSDVEIATDVLLQLYFKLEVFMEELADCEAKNCPKTGFVVPGGGMYLGGELVKNWGSVRSTERLAATDVLTNQFSDRADPLGGGFLIGYKFAPWANRRNSKIT